MLQHFSMLEWNQILTSVSLMCFHSKSDFMMTLPLHMCLAWNDYETRLDTKTLNRNKCMTHKQKVQRNRIDIRRTLKNDRKTHVRTWTRTQRNNLKTPLSSILHTLDSLFGFLWMTLRNKKKNNDEKLTCSCVINNPKMRCGWLEGVLAGGWVGGEKWRG